MRVDNIKTYLLKNGLLYDLSAPGALAPPVKFEDVDLYEKYRVLIDDEYFYCIQVGHLNVSIKKLRQIISNYIQTIVPSSLLSDFAIASAGGVYYAFLFNVELSSLLDQNLFFFERASSISSCLCELLVRYPSFSYSDGVRVYEKTDGVLIFQPSQNSGTLHPQDIWGELESFRGDLEFKDIKLKSSGGKLKRAILVLFLCYMCFLFGLIFDYKSSVKELSLYEMEIIEHYEIAGVADAKDPYGMLLSKVSAIGDVETSISSVINFLSQSVIDGVVIDTFSIGEKSVKVEGTAANFQQVDVFKANLERLSRKNILIEDSRQSGEKVKFLLRFDI